MEKGRVANEQMGQCSGGTFARSLTYITHVKRKLQTGQVHNGFEKDNQFDSLATGGHQKEITVLIC